MELEPSKIQEAAKNKETDRKMDSDHHASEPPKLDESDEKSNAETDPSKAQEVEKIKETNQNIDPLPDNASEKQNATRVSALSMILESLSQIRVFKTELENFQEKQQIFTEDKAAVQSLQGLHDFLVNNLSLNDPMEANSAYDMLLTIMELLRELGSLDSHFEVYKSEEYPAERSYVLLVDAYSIRETKDAFKDFMCENILKAITNNKLPSVYTIAIEWEKDETNSTIILTTSRLETEIDNKGHCPYTKYRLVSMVCWDGDEYSCVANENNGWVRHFHSEKEVIGAWDRVINIFVTQMIRPEILFFEYAKGKELDCARAKNDTRIPTTPFAQVHENAPEPMKPEESEEEQNVTRQSDLYMIVKGAVSKDDQSFYFFNLKQSFTKVCQLFELMNPDETKQFREMAPAQKIIYLKKLEEEGNRMHAAPAVSRPAAAVSRPTPAVSRPAAAVSRPVPAVSQPVPAVSQPVPAVKNKKHKTATKTPKDPIKLERLDWSAIDFSVPPPPAHNGKKKEKKNEMKPRDKKEMESSEMEPSDKKENEPPSKEVEMELERDLKKKELYDSPSKEVEMEPERDLKKNELNDSPSKEVEMETERDLKKELLKGLQEVNQLILEFKELNSKIAESESESESDAGKKERELAVENLNEVVKKFTRGVLHDSGNGEDLQKLLVLLGEVKGCKRMAEEKVFNVKRLIERIKKRKDNSEKKRR